MPQTPSMSAASPGTAQPANGLTESDYAQLLQMSMSEDASARSQASALAKKMTPAESQAFYTYQKQALQTAPTKSTTVAGVPITVAGERPRPDSNIAGNDQGSGIAPEDALMGGMMAKAVAKAAAAPAGNVLGQARAALAAVATQAGPIVKYEIVRHALEAAGVSPKISVPLAMMVSGYSKKGAASAPAEAAPAAAPSVNLDEATAAAQAARAAKFGTPPAAAATPAGPVEPVEAPPASVPPGPQSAPGATPTGQVLMKMIQSNQLSPKEANAALQLLQQGVEPARVEAQILGARAPSAPSVAPAAAAAPAPNVAMSPARIGNELAMAARRAKVTLTPQDYEALVPLVQKGATPADAIAQLPALQLQRMPGVMTPEQMNAEIAARGPGNRSPKR